MPCQAKTGSAFKAEVSHRFDAPCQRIFKLWTTAAHLSRWFYPDGFTVQSCEVDFRDGGVFNVRMRSPDGVEFPSRGRYREITVPERIVFASAVLGDDDKPRFEVLSAVTFAEENRGETTITVRAAVEAIFDPMAVASVNGMGDSWAQTLNRLVAYTLETGDNRLMTQGARGCR